MKRFIEVFHVCLVVKNIPYFLDISSYCTCLWTTQFCGL